MKKIYDTIEKEQVEVVNAEYESLPNDIDSYHIAYVGKHKAIQPNSGSKDLTEKDIDENLLIECRLFKEKEEIYIFLRKGELRQRTVTLGSGNPKKSYIEKKIQLRNPQGASGTTNDTLIVHHYIKQDGGYDFMRYVKIDNSKTTSDE